MLTFAFGSLFVVFGFLIFGGLMLNDSLMRQNEIREDIWQYEHVDKPHRESLMQDAALHGFTNSDLIFNRTTLCWYKYETDTLYGDCDGERERIDQIKLESKKYENMTWAEPAIQLTEWQSISNGSES